MREHPMGGEPKGGDVIGGRREHRVQTAGGGRMRLKRVQGLLAVGSTLALLAVACGGGGEGAGGADDGADEPYVLGYSAPFLFSPFEVIQQDKVVETAEAQGFEVLPPTNADGEQSLAWAASRCFPRPSAPYCTP